MTLREPQQMRHKMLRFYVKQWFSDSASTWDEFIAKATPKAQECGIRKPLAKGKHQLAKNLQAILSVIKEHYRSKFSIQDILLYLHHDPQAPQPKPPQNFTLVPIDYSECLLKGSSFVEFEL